MDVTEILQEIKDLLQESESFTFENFSSKRVRNLPAEFSPKWVSWHNRVDHLVNICLPQNSTPHFLMKKVTEMSLIGANEEKFKAAKSYINQALEEAIEFINNEQKKYFLIPSDNFTILSTNQEELEVQALSSTPKIFISHTTRQEELVQRLVAVFESAFSVHPGEIRCTSLPGYGFPISSNVTSQLRTEIEQAEIVIGIITPDSIQSNVLFELGAAWGFQKSIFLLLASGATVDNIPSFLTQLNSIILTDIRRCYELIDQLMGQTTVQKKENVNVIVAGAIQKLVEISLGQYSIELQQEDHRNSPDYSNSRELAEIAKLLASRPTQVSVMATGQENRNIKISKGDYRETAVNDQGSYIEGDNHSTSQAEES